MKPILPLLIFLIAITGCSNRGAYEGVQTGSRVECSKLPPPQYDECMENANKSYDQYAREREEAITE